MALVERERELTAIDSMVDDLGHGEGGGLLVHGHAGIGKSALIAAAVVRARAAGLRVLSACGGELEQSYAFGVVRQLYDPLVRSGVRSRRADLLSGTARFAAPVFGLPVPAASPSPPDPQESALLGLFWLTSDLAHQQPMLIALDDFQWADRASVAWLVFTLRRLAGLPVAVICAARTAEGIAFDQLAPEGGHVEVVTLAPLSDDGVRAVVGEHFPSSPDEAFCRAVIEATAGNPMLVHEVVRAAADGGREPTGLQAADAVRVPSEQLTRLVEARLSRLPADAVALARGAAVLGGGAELRHAAALAGLELDLAADAADKLRAGDVLARGSRLSFAHPLVRDIVERSIPSGRRAAAHARAARLLDGEQGSTESVAAHLLHSEPAGDPWADGRLRAAGGAALVRGAPESAITLLRRALREGCPDARVELLVALGGAEALVRDEEAVKHLRAAAELASEPRQRLEIVLALAGYMLSTGDYLLDAYVTLEQSIPEAMAVDRDLGLRMEATLACSGRVVPSWAVRVAERMREYEDVEFSADTPGERAMLACQAAEAAALGTGVARAADRARRALTGGALLTDQAGASPIFLVACVALTHSDRYAEARAALDDALADAQARGSAIAFALVSAWRAEAAYRAGDLLAAGADAQSALAVGAERGPLVSDPLAVAWLVHVLLEQGRPDDASAALERYEGPHLPPLWHAVLLDARARVQMQRRDYAAAAEAFVRAGELQLSCAVPGPQFIAWRTGAVRALAALGDMARASELADEALAGARRAEAPRATGSALRAKALVASEPERLELLREAVAVLESSEARLEQAQAQCELGTALRHARSSKAAREPLRAALDLAVRCGATALIEHALAELRAAGGRPRRITISGRDALTPAEARTAQLAADGLTNREIAQTLFVTAKTVETQLARAYQKLAIHSRRELASALEAGASPAV
jgi:DNA-binding CsgD family transcriptional regulator